MSEEMKKPLKITETVLRDAHQSLIATRMTTEEIENQKRIDACDYLTNAVSTQDCTGLIPSAPVSDAELESYEEVYHYQPPKVKKK